MPINPMCFGIKWLLVIGEFLCASDLYDDGLYVVCLYNKCLYNKCHFRTSDISDNIFTDERWSSRSCQHDLLLLEFT